MGDCCGCWLSVSLSSICLAILLVAVLDWIKRRNKANASLVNQHVVITGGSSGIGKQVAILASQRGANVTILARDLKKLEEASTEVRAAAKDDNQKINYFSVDVTNYEQADNVLQRCAEEIGAVDILICCAGYAYPSKLEDIPLHHVKGMMDINYFGTLHVVRSVLPSMKSRRKGKIACTSSVGGLFGIYGYTAYGASKFALRGFAEALQMEVKPFNISVTLCFPPDTDTPCLQEENKVKPLETKLISEAAAVMKPEDVARSILNDTMTGDFFSCTGFDGNLTSVICAGMSPVSSVFGLIIQICFMGIFRAVGLVYIFYFNRLVKNCAAQKEKLKKAE